MLSVKFLTDSLTLLNKGASRLALIASSSWCLSLAACLLVSVVNMDMKLLTMSKLLSTDLKSCLCYSYAFLFSASSVAVNVLEGSMVLLFLD